MIRKRDDRHDRITDKYRLWANWFAGAVSHYADVYRAPLHPDLSREYYLGRDAAAAGYVKVGDIAQAVEMVRHVQAGNPPHTFRAEQIGMAI